MGKTMEVTEAVVLIAAFLFILGVICLVVSRKMRKKRSIDVDALIETNNADSSITATRYSSTGTAQTIPPAQVEAVRRAQDFRIRAKIRQTSIRDTTGTEAESVPCSSMDQMEFDHHLDHRGFDPVDNVDWRPAEDVV